MQENVKCTKNTSSSSRTNTFKLVIIRLFLTIIRACCCILSTTSINEIQIVITMFGTYLSLTNYNHVLRYYSFVTQNCLRGSSRLRWRIVNKKHDAKAIHVLIK